MRRNGNEIELDNRDMIVSTTDLQGHILYANDAFCQAAGYERSELLGKPHNIIRHEEMPAAIFYLLWQRLQAGKSIYAFVKNRSKEGFFYWVKAYVTPIVQGGKVTQYTSYRKVIHPFAKEFIEDFYKTLLSVEKQKGMERSVAYLNGFLDKRKLSYDHFVDRLSEGKSVANPVLLSLDRDRHRILYTLFIQRQLRESGTSDPCQSEFGKWLEATREENFTKEAIFEDVRSHHDAVCTLLGSYAEGSANDSKAKGALKTRLNEHSRSLFTELGKLVDSCKE